MTEHYFTKKPTSPLKTKDIKLTLDNTLLRFTTPSGVFSFGRVDKGSLLLLQHVVVREKWNVLDFGCGWGLIGIVLKKFHPTIHVLMTDVNVRALDFARDNTKLNNVDIRVNQSDLFSKIDELFDTIIVNPPMKAGRKICYAIIDQSKNHLKKGGLLQLVALHNKGGKMLQKRMEEIFGNVETIVKSGGFRVYHSTR
jgi:16S rRNA (guanine1207-N2)-methyltransferase